MLVSLSWSVRQVYLPCWCHFHGLCARCNPPCWCHIHGLCARCNPPCWCQIHGVCARCTHLVGVRFTVCAPGVTHIVGVIFMVSAPGVPILLVSESGSVRPVYLSCWCHGLCARCNPPWWCQIHGSLVSFFFACLVGFMSELARWCWKSVSSPSPSSFPALIFCRKLTCSHRSVQENTPCTSLIVSV